MKHLSSGFHKVLGVSMGLLMLTCLVIFVRVML
jgi:hypothetical protein